MRRVHFSMGLFDDLARTSSALSTWTWYLPSGTSSNSRSSTAASANSSSKTERSMSEASLPGSSENPYPAMRSVLSWKGQRLPAGEVRGAEVALGGAGGEPLARGELGGEPGALGAGMYGF